MNYVNIILLSEKAITQTGNLGKENIIIKFQIENKHPLSGH